MSHSPTIEVQNYGTSLEVEDEELEALWEIFDDGDVGQYFTEDVIVLARDADGDIIGGVTESGGDELTVAVHEDERGSGLGTAMIKALAAAGGGGYMVAGTDAGLSLIHSLYYSLTPDERERFDAPSWGALEES